MEDDFEYALTVVSTITSRPIPERGIMDAGLQDDVRRRERPAAADRPARRQLVYLSAEHGNLALEPEAQGLRIGDRVEWILGYSDTTTFLHNHFVGPARRPGRGGHPAARSRQADLSGPDVDGRRRPGPTPPVRARQRRRLRRAALDGSTPRRRCRTARRGSPSLDRRRLPPSPATCRRCRRCRGSRPRPSTPIPSGAQLRAPSSASRRRWASSTPRASSCRSSSSGSAARTSRSAC